jgi:predicted amidohydrolase YtcJ
MRSDDRTSARTRKRARGPRWHRVATARKAPAALLPLLLLLLATGCETAPAAGGGADLVLLNGTVVTVDPQIGEAEALAILDGRILSVGTTADIEAFADGGTEVIDLEGRLAIPGFIEGHGHYLGFGRSRMILDLTGVRSWEEMVELVAEAAAGAEPGEWIVGRGWHQERWDPPPPDAIEGVPPHAAMSARTPDNPVHLTHASGHASFANARALEEGGIDRDTPDPPGGEIVKDGDGEPTGLLRETAQRIVTAAYDEARAGMTAQERQAEFEAQVRLAGEEALRHGVTTFRDAGSTFEDLDRFRELADRGELPIRLYPMVRRETNEPMAENLARYRTEDHADHHLVVRSIKRQIDGALGAHGAWLLEPYEDLPGSTGLVLEEPDDIRRTGELALEHGYQLNTHAIGDRANRVVLDLYEELLRQNAELVEDHRWSIEHAQHLHPDDIPRFAELGVIASMQGIHGTSDGPWVLARLGPERAESGAYMWRDLIDSGAVICNGTDAPVEPISPIASFHASVSRVMETGETFYAERAMTRMEALESYTINCAWASFMEDVVGSITPGKYADIVVLDRDIMTVPEEEIPGAQVDLTILAGEVRFRR